MNRRQFLPALAAPLAAPAQESKIRIEAVELMEYEGTIEADKNTNKQYQAQPLHIYEAHRPKPYRDATPAQRGPQKIRATYLRLRASGGIEGFYGPIDKEASLVIDQQLRAFLIGKDGLAGDIVWDQLWRLNRHGRTGHFLLAISAIDNALWDLRGRYFRAPVYRLLGGPSRNSVDLYSSTLGYTLELDKIRDRAQALLAAGYRRQKWFLADGPGSGPEGFRRNVKIVEILREAVGEDTELMFDVFNGWDFPYALKWCKAVEHFRPRWLEEPFSSEKVDAYARLSASTSVPIATGEHFYGRWEVQRFLKSDAVRVIQADPEWCGGISELVKIATLSSIYDVPVIPHGHSLHAALHFVGSQPPSLCPWSEFLVLKMADYYHFEQNAPKPVNGAITLRDQPGFGISIDPAKIENQRILNWKA